MLSGNFAEMTTSTSFRDLLHAANLRHGTDGFTSHPKEGVLRIFSPLKIRRLRPGLNPRTWVLKASTLPIDHRLYLHKIAGQITKNCFSPNLLFLPSGSASYNNSLYLTVLFVKLNKICPRNAQKHFLD